MTGTVTPASERLQQIGAVYIPSSIMCEESLTLTQKIIWGRVQGLSTKEGYCYASNKWIGEQLGLSQSTISNNISTLVMRGYMVRKIIRNDKKEIKERRLYSLSLLAGIPITGKSDTPITGKSEGSITDLSLGVEKDSMVEKTDPAIKVLKYLNGKSVTPFPLSKTNLKGIHGRIKDGATVEELELVIDFKAAAWQNDERMWEYLRPKTLFGPDNFVGYLTGAKGWVTQGKPALRKNKNKKPAAFVDDRRNELVRELNDRLTRKRS